MTPLQGLAGFAILAGLVILAVTETAGPKARAPHIRHAKKAPDRGLCDACFYGEKTALN